MIRILLTLLITLLPWPLHADQEEIVLGMSQNKVAITAQFDGSDILIFGAVKRETPIPDLPLDVIITIEGPSKPVTVWRKDRVLGLWINTDSLVAKRAPVFYAVASSRPLETILTTSENYRYAISVDRAIPATYYSFLFEDTAKFTDALLRIQEENGSYISLEDKVEVDQQTLFRTSIQLPSNLTEGDYQARIFLIRDGDVVSELKTVIDVRKVGLERFLYNLAQDNAALYGLLSLLLAIAAGWGASALFQLIRNG